ncbi:hypothetical protein DSM106972_052860 [Dulcicalothrix desertica PCC 7102]|uniref:Prevent-host-death protein n=1 Tax=Dulcicalothrix desertica PCC 7102 TaxID=232991 RepID=A0A433VC59_9CYAN|nr:hypothetical protein [Dulcicalothrix desertica]RUT03647.1 hypothetical protein DSM106972_052860 [Dulcicalothrix desertica PCC 7102]TWH43913.1 hypothetical protein CAL7102_07665 [Dulcicalothrix desertica PCC 7102]
MRTIDLSTTNTNLTEILSLAGDETIIIRTPLGREFVISEVDDFAHEVAYSAQNQELMAFLAERSCIDKAV